MDISTPWRHKERHWFAKLGFTLGAFCRRIAHTQVYFLIPRRFVLGFLVILDTKAMFPGVDRAKKTAPHFPSIPALRSQG
jgi:hypothetical protein